MQSSAEGDVCSLETEIEVDMTQRRLYHSVDLLTTLTPPVVPLISTCEHNVNHLSACQLLTGQGHAVFTENERTRCTEDSEAIVERY